MDDVKAREALGLPRPELRPLRQAARGHLQSCSVIPANDKYWSKVRHGFDKQASNRSCSGKCVFMTLVLTVVSRTSWTDARLWVHGRSERSTMLGLSRLCSACLRVSTHYYLLPLRYKMNHCKACNMTLLARMRTYRVRDFLYWSYVSVCHNSEMNYGQATEEWSNSYLVPRQLSRFYLSTLQVGMVLCLYHQSSHPTGRYEC
jgi:hypothetical protein